MKEQLLIPVILTLIIVGMSVASYSDPEEEVNLMETASENEMNESVIAFNKMMDVLTHQRCLNCHPSDNIPKQGEDSHDHRFGITRVNGVSTTNCNTCHQDSNNKYSGVPGAPHWALAPHKMRWEGLSRTEIAKSMMNPRNNGNRSAEDIMHHLTEHELVLWAWEPGVDAEGNPRELPPVPVEEYIAAVKKWIALGAVIPEEEPKP